MCIRDSVVAVHKVPRLASCSLDELPEHLRVGEPLMRITTLVYEAGDVDYLCDQVNSSQDFEDWTKKHRWCGQTSFTFGVIPEGGTRSSGCDAASLIAADLGSASGPTPNSRQQSEQKLQKIETTKPKAVGSADSRCARCLRGETHYACVSCEQRVCSLCWVPGRAKCTKCAYQDTVGVSDSDRCSKCNRVSKTDELEECDHCEQKVCRHCYLELCGLCTGCGWDEATGDEIRAVNEAHALRDSEALCTVCKVAPTIYSPAGGAMDAPAAKAVSYTHLTLPTILLV